MGGGDLVAGAEFERVFKEYSKSIQKVFKEYSKECSEEHSKKYSEEYSKSIRKGIRKSIQRAFERVFERVIERVFKEYSKHISKEHSKDESKNLQIIFKMFKREREEVLSPKGKRERGESGKLQAAPMPVTFSNRTASHARTHERNETISRLASPRPPNSADPVGV